MNIPKQVHFIGIGGYGMSAIAKVMLEMGFAITGSDLQSSGLTDKLEAGGARIHIGHDAAHVGDAGLAVYSTALPQDNVEVIEAKKRGIPVIHRSEMLAMLMNEKKGIAVAGAHGKTTTSSMIAYVMEAGGAEPTFVIGGEITNLGCNAKAGKGKYVVAEADESDGSFLKYQPYIAVVTNIEADHLENYGGEFANLKKAYATFLSQIKEGGKAIVCLDDAELQGMITDLTVDCITYGIDTAAQYTARHIIYGDRKVSFDVFHHDEKLGSIRLSVPGKHNVYNALATLVVCLHAGLNFETIASGLYDFHGAKRRFQVLADVNDILVIDDYAHHPTEIEATLHAARTTGNRLIAVFQPQRYTRTYFLLDQFSKAFGQSDEVIVTDIYSPAGEKQIEGVNAAKLVELIKQNSNPNVRHIPTKEEVEQYLLEHIKSGDTVLTMGAGDIWRVSDSIARRLSKQSLGS